MFSKKSCLLSTFVFQASLCENQGKNGVFIKIEIHRLYVRNIKFLKHNYSYNVMYTYSLIFVWKSYIIYGCAVEFEFQKHYPRIYFKCTFAICVWVIDRFCWIYIYVKYTQYLPRWAQEYNLSNSKLSML